MTRPPRIAERRRSSPPAARIVTGWLRRRPVTAGFSLLLSIGSAVLAALNPVARSALLQWGSTNLGNLQHRPAVVLVLSAFLTEHNGMAWVALSLLGLGTLEPILGPARMAALASAGQLIGTAVSEGLLWYRIRLGDQPASARHIVDVGPSFVVVTALIATAVAGAVTTRVVMLVTFAVLAPALFEGITRFDVAAVGHAAAAVTGALGGYVHRRRHHRAKRDPGRPAP